VASVRLREYVVNELRRNSLRLVELDHPVARDLLTRMRESGTPPREFLDLGRGISSLLAFEVTRHLGTHPVRVETPLEPAFGELVTPQPVLVAVLRAGLGMLDSFTSVLPSAAVGFVAIRRDEGTARPVWYYDSVPDPSGRTAILLDPMLATGGTSVAAVEFLLGRGASAVVLAAIVAAPEGISALSGFDRLTVVTAAVDRDLDSRWYIRPGLGDFGDRLYAEGSPSGGLRN
jgi:uracil phosphoribosyltransferase